MANPRPLRDFVQAVTKEPREAELLATVRGNLASLVARDDWSEACAKANQGDHISRARTA